MNRSWPAKGILSISLLAIWSCTDTASLLTPEARPQASHLIPDCFGRNATIYIGSPGAGTITPDGSGGYTITGTSGDDVIIGGPGNDIINAGDGTDRICAGDGDDVLSGGNGTNHIDGELGSDVVDYSGAATGVRVNLVTGTGRSATIIDATLLNIENIIGTAFDDELRGNALANSIRGGDGNDILYGAEAADSLFGQADNDVLHGGDDADVLSGGTGDDEIIPGLGADWIVGQGGFDVVSYKGSVAVEVNLATNIGANGDAAGDTWRGIEGIIGTNGNDVLTGDDYQNWIHGGAGDDVINGGGHRDRLSGGPGADEIHGGDEDDHISGQEGDDELYGDEGDDVFSSGPGLNVVDGGNGNDRMVSTNCLDSMTSIEIMQSGRCTEDTTNSTVTAAASSITADGASTTTITVQLKDAGGNDFTVGGATVVLSTDAGTLSNGGTPAASVTATDQNDGSYTAALIASTTLETATVTATVNGDALADDATVTFTVGALDHFLIEAAGGGAIATQVKGVPFNIQVTAQDANNHTVTDFTGTVALDYEGDVSGSITPASSAFTAGVLSSQSVTIGATGASVQIRATDGDANTGVSLAFAVDPSDDAPTVTSTTPADAATGIAATDAIDIVFSEDVTVTAASFDLECPATTDHAFTLSGSNANYTLTPNSTLPGVTTCTVTVIAANVSDTDTDDAPDNMAADYVFSFTTAPFASPDTYTETVLGNVSVNSANAATSFSVLANDDIDGGTTITNVGWTGIPNVTENGGNVSITPGGTFTYNPPAGFEGTDRFTYTITGGSSADVTLTVSGMLWFVNNAAASCLSVAAGCGRLSNPLSTLAALNSENSGVGNRPAAGDGIFLYESGSAYPGAISLLANQKLIGQDATESLASLGYTVPASGAALPVMDGANGTKVTISGADGINLGADNTLRGFTVATTAGEAIGGSSFGTLTLSGGVPDVTIASSGQALGLTTGTINGTFASVGSTGGTHNVHLDGVSASALTFGSGTLSGATGIAVRIAGGNPLNLTVAGAVTQAANAALLDVSGSHSGTLNFTNTSNLQATNGTGLQFNAAGGTYTFGGTTNLAGGDAGVDITNGSGGTFTFAAGTTITNPSGVGFRLYGSTASVTYSGNMSKSSAGNIIEIGEHSTGTATFNTGTISATGGSGINFSNADGTYDFNGTTTMNGGDAHVHVASGSAGAITFGTGASVTNPSTTAALAILNSVSATNVTFNGPIATNAARPVQIEGVSGGTVAVTGAISTSAGLGMLIQNNTGGTMTFSNAAKTFTTGANGAVTLSNNTGATVNFSSGGLALTTTSGAGLSATGGGTLNITGANNTANATAGGTPVNIQNTTIGGSGVTFQSVSGSGGSNGIFLSSTGNSGGAFTVTGTGTSGSGGTIVNTSGGDGATSGNGIYLNGTRNVSLSWMNLSGHTNNGMFSTGHRGSLTMHKMRFTGNNGTSNSGTFDESAVSLVNHGGATKITGSRLDGGAFNGLRVENIDGTAPALDSLVLESDTVETMQGSVVDVRSTALLVNLMDGSADVRIRSNRVTVWWGNAIHVLIQGTASGSARITNNFADNTNGALAGAGGIWVGGCTFAFNISNNTVRNTNGTAISADKANCAGSTFQGTIDSNAIGVSGVANSGSGTGIGIFAAGRNGTTTVRISNNTLRQINGSANGAITTAVGDNVAFPVTGTLNATIVGNNIQESGTTPNNAQHGIFVNHGVTSSGTGDNHTGCYDVGGAGGLANTIINFTSGTANNRIRVQQRFTGVSRFPGYTGANNDNAAMATYLLGRNTASTTAISNNVSAGGGGFTNTIPAGSACPQPSM